MTQILVLLLIVAALLFVSWYKRAPGTQRKSVRNKALVAGGLGLLLVLMLTGRLHPLMAAALALVPLIQRVLGAAHLVQQVRGLGNAFRSGPGPSQGQTSEVSTRFLRMTLNHDTGQMDGMVVEGTQQGRRLSQLALGELLELLEECREADAQSVAVLEAYLDRVHGDAWRDAGAAGRQNATVGSSGMTEAEAREILGVGPADGREAIVDAHRRLMQKMHPDRGGSTYLAAKINKAKDLLLEKLEV